MQRSSYSFDASVRPGSRKLALAVLAAAALIALCGRSIVGEMFHRTANLGWRVPEGSASLGSKQRANQFFPTRMEGAIVMAVETLPGTPSVLTPAVAEFSRNVSESVKQDSRVATFAPIVVGYYLNHNLADGLRKQLQDELVSEDKQITVIVIQPTKIEGQFEQVNAFLEEFCHSPPPGYTLHITGMMSVLSGEGCYSGFHKKVNTRNMNFEDLARAEMITIPIALCIIAGLVKFYVRLLLLPLLTLIIAFVVASALMLPWMKEDVRVPADCPAAMGSVILALCLDYGLFFLTRFSEQHRQGMPLQRNVDTILAKTGKTVAISGTLVAIAFFTSMILPEDNLKGTGFVMGLATISCMVVSIVLLPAILLVAGRMLTGGIVRTPVDVDMGSFNEREELDEFGGDPRVQFKETSHWLNMMRLMDRSPYTAVALVCVLMTPFFMCLPFLSISGDRFALMPMGMPAMSALRRVQESFPVGILDPYAILITAPGRVGSAHLSHEITDGIASLESHDVKAMVANLGLSTEDAEAFEKAVKAMNIEHEGGKAGKLESSVSCKTLAAVGAGVSYGAANVDGASDAHVLKEALRSAQKTGCAPAEVQEAVAASASVLYASRERQLPGRTKHAAVSDTKEAVRTEAVKLGMSQAAASSLADRISESSRHGQQVDSDEHLATQAAVRAGAAMGLGKIHGKDDIDSLRESLYSLNGYDISMAQASQVMRAAMVILQKAESTAGDATKEVKAEGKKQGLNDHAASEVAKMLMAVTKKGSKDAHVSEAVKKSDVPTPVVDKAHEAGAEVTEHSNDVDKDFHKKWGLALDLIRAVDHLTGKDHGMLLMPSGFKAMLDLSHAVYGVGNVASMLGPAWALHQSIDWVTAVAMHLNTKESHMYQPLLSSHVNGNRALLEVHTTFPSIGPGGSDWVLDVRRALADWESSHPGYKAELSGGASEAADTRHAVMHAMWSYLALSVSLIMLVVFCTFRSFMVPLRLAFALFFTMAATYGVAVIVYQTSLLHRICPWLAPFHGLTYEVVPMVTGVAVALGLDYDIFLVTRIVEFRMQGYTDRASVFRGATKAGGVISGAGLIMALAFTGLCFSDKLLMQQFGVLLVTSVIFDTFVVRTVLVPALMLIAQDWNWWPRRMPAAYKTSLEGDGDMSEDSNLHYRQLLG